MELKFLKRKKVFRKGGLHTNPDVFWNALQLLAVVALFSFFVFDFYLFKDINKDFVSPVTSGAQAKTISKEHIDKALEYFGGKEKKFNEILNSPSPIVDPSK